MSEEVLRYDKMVEFALRDVVRSALAFAAENGLPGAHHFYITFSTDGSNVEMADSLRAQYPEEMTIVLQHQYWDLTVTEDRFEVTLTFNKVPHHLVVPLEAITSFFDPSVQFGLKFQALEQDDGEGEGQTAANADTPQEADGGESGEVITLDAFRKK